MIILGRLKFWQLILFPIGLILDSMGTGIMFDYVGGMSWNIHEVSGFLAIILMIHHAGWALIVPLKKDEK